MLRLIHVPDAGTVVSKQLVQTHRLDDLNLPEIDMVKIDVQGSELSILENGRETLSNAVFVHIEVSFLPLYKDQPVFWQIDKELREQGFVPHCFANIRRCAIAPLVVVQGKEAVLNQMVEADVAYCRDFVWPGTMTADQWKHLAVIAFYCYQSPDLAMRAISALVHLGAMPNTAPQQFLKA